MQSNNTHRHGLIVFLCASVAIHGLLLTLKLTPPQGESRHSAPRMALVPAPEPRHPVAPSPTVAIGGVSTRPEIDQEFPQRTDRDTGSAGTTAPSRRSRKESTRPATELRKQALALAGQAVDSEDAGESGSLPGLTRMPRLPGGAGWMDAYLGPVATGTERWQGADGSMNSRSVLANGRVVCASVRPPTMDETFNPWMSSAVPMSRNCGRERPQASNDFRDPWQRRGPQKK